MKRTLPNILLFGKNGQVGLVLSEGLRRLGNVNAVGRKECDLFNPYAIKQIIKSTRPDIIINAAAYTAVDQAEIAPDIAYAVNTQAPQVMAECAAGLNALIVHYSSDYVFDGQKGSPYIESDEPNPLSVYGRSKWQAEQMIKQTCSHHLIFRTSWLHSPHGTGFLNTILKHAKNDTALNDTALDVVSDQTGTPTSVKLLTATTQNILQQYITTGSLPYGTFHLVPNGGTSRDNYARTVVHLAKEYRLPIKLKKENIRSVVAIWHPTGLALRPTDSRLNNHLLQRTFNLQLPIWQDDVRHTIQQIASVEHG